MCTNLDFVIFCFSILHRSEVRTALISNTLMCSEASFHFHPVIVFQRHKLAGTLARSRWYFTWSSLEAWSRRSSPFTLTNVSSLDTTLNSFEWPTNLRPGRISGRCKKVWKSLQHPGDVLSTTCCTLRWGFNPKSEPNWLKIQLTTVTFQEFPIRDSLQSVCAVLPWTCLPIHITV